MFKSPEWNEPSPEEELPTWARNIKISYQIFKETWKEMEDKISPGREENGYYNREGRFRIRTEFYNLIQQIKEKGDLPEFIPLGELRKTTGVNLENDSVEFHITAEEEYYLPNTHEHYLLPYYGSLEMKEKLSPENKNFVGFEKIRNDEGSLAIFTDLRPLSRHEVLDEKKDLYRDLWGEDIEKILDYLENKLTTPQNKKLIQEFRNETTLISSKADEDIARAKKEYISKIKRRIFNLTDAIIKGLEESKERIPKEIYVECFKWQGGKCVEEKHFLPYEKKFVVVPKKSKLGGVIEGLNFSKAREVPEEAWLYPSMLEGSLRDLLPKKLREKIFHS